MSIRLGSALALALTALLGACGSSASSPDGGATITDATVSDAWVNPPGALVINWGQVEVQPGEEHTECVTKRLGNVGEIKVGMIHNTLSEASHHLIVYRVGDPTEQPDPYPCQPFTDTLDPTKGSPLMVTQKHDDTLQLPPGVAFTLDNNQMIRIEMHFINTTDNTLTATAETTFVPMNPADFQNEAGFLFIGSPDINIPAMATQTVGPDFLKLPPEYVNANFFAITGHTHKFGTNVTVDVATSLTDASATSVYNIPNWLWSEPTTATFATPFKVPAGSGFRFKCDYQNTSNQPVSFGESASNEMCFFWAYYYPDQGAKVCIHTDQVPGGFDLCCPNSDMTLQGYCDQFLGH